MAAFYENKAINSRKTRIELRERPAKYEGKSKIIRTFIFMDYFKNTKHENDLSFFYIISTHFDALVPAVYKLINAI